MTLDRAQHVQALPGSDFDAVVRAWLATKGSANTRAAYQRDIACFAAWMATSGRLAHAASPDDVDAFRQHSENSGLGPATVNRRLAALSSLFRFHGAATGGANPVDGAERPASSASSATAPLGAAQADQVWLAAQALGPRTSALVGLLLLDGLKVNEILVLDIADVSLHGRRPTALVDRRGSRHPIVLDPRTAVALRATVKGRDDGPVLIADSPGRVATRLTRYGVDYLLKRTGAQAGLDAPLSANVLRSTHIATAHAAGVDVEQLQRNVGHASSRTTLRYVVARES